MGSFCLSLLKRVVCVTDVKSKALCKEGPGTGREKGRAFFFASSATRKSVPLHASNAGYIREPGLQLNGQPLRYQFPLFPTVSTYIFSPGQSFLSFGHHVMTLKFHDTFKQYYHSNVKSWSYATLTSISLFYGCFWGTRTQSEESTRLHVTEDEVLSLRSIINSSIQV